LAEEGTNGVPSDQAVNIPCVVGKEVIWSHLRQEHPNRWKTCEGCHHLNTLMSEPLPSRKKELHAMRRQKLYVAVGILKGHTTLRANTFKLGLKKWQDCRLCRDKKKIVGTLYVTDRHWHAKYTEPCIICS
jgi:hypothetical protein